MADQTNTGLPSASALTGAESFYTVQGGNSREGLISQLLDYVMPRHKLVPGVDISTTTYTIQDTDIYAAYSLTNAAGCTVIVPLNATEAVPIGARVRFAAEGAGGVTVDVESGAVTIINRGDLRVGDQGSIIELHKVGTDKWWLLGDLQS